MKKFMVGGILMDLPIILGAGAVKHPAGMQNYLHKDGPLGGGISGSYTLEARQGNKGQLAWPADIGEIFRNGFALNSWGMPNIGLSKAIELFPENPEKPHIISIAGFQVSDYVCMLELLKGNKHIAGVELNMGCPNTGHLPAAYVLDDLARLLEDVSKVGFDLPTWLKLSPYMTANELAEFAHANPGLDVGDTPTVHEGFIEELCELLIEYQHVVSAVVMTNTLPFVKYGDTITVQNPDGSKNHKGGLSGPILREHNLRLIKRMVATGITGDIDLIGCGGILTGRHVREYFYAGCAGVECTSGPAWFTNGMKFFQSLLEESGGLQEYLFNQTGGVE